MTVKKSYLWILALVISIGHLAFHAPLDVFNIQPATGGDTGSHFYTLWRLAQSGFRVWDPGHLTGEQQMVHYFPGPFFIMYFLSRFMPLGLAFNLGTIIPVALFPLSVFFAVRGIGKSFIAAFLSLGLSIIFLYNESYTMWGGNGVSTMAGQFAHMYALNFLMLLIGILGIEFRTNKRYYFSAVIISLIAVTHTYILLLAPFILLSFLLLAYDFENPSWNENKYKLWDRFKYLFKVGVLGIGLSLWFIIPQILNAKWTMPIAMEWVFNNPWSEIVPTGLRPFWFLLVLLLPTVTYLAGAKKISLNSLMSDVIVCLIPVAASVLGYFTFEKLGLVDVRTLPQLMLFLALYSAFVLSDFFEAYVTEWKITLTALMVMTCLWLAHKQNVNFTYWATWNYSSWKKKEWFPKVQPVFDFLRGDYSDPRVANEHHPDLVKTGTTRVFELLPVFTGRATMESLYAESTHTSFMAHDIQARISKNASCPVRGFKCDVLSTDTLAAKMDLIGIRDLIMMGTESISVVSKQKSLKVAFENEPFKVLRLDPAPKLATVLSAQPGVNSTEPWRILFQDWYLAYDGKQNPIISTNEKNLKFNVNEHNAKECHPQVKAEINKLTLTTDCPGLLHMLKFSYLPNLISESEEPIYFISPGFMALAPKGNSVIITYRKPLAWTIAGLISLALWLSWTVLIIRRYRTDSSVGNK